MNNTEFTPVITDAKKSNKKPLVILVVAIILGLGGVGYWYVMMYQPAQYAKAIFTLEAEMQSYGAQSGQPQFRWRYDYETALNALDKHETFFVQFNKKIEALNPPLFDREMEELKENLLLFGKESSGGVNNSRRAIAFVKDAIGIYKIYYPESSTIQATLPPDIRRPPSIIPRTQPSDLATLFEQWKSMLEAAKPYADRMFNQEPINLGDNYFSDLKYLWEEIYNATKTVLPVIESRFGPSFPVQSLPSPTELEKTIPGAASLDKIDDFLQKLESVIIRGSAEGIFQSAVYPQSPNLQSRSQSMNESMKKLKEKYGK
ncbi:MAG: hypothetical protein UW79_C0015G0019 [Candidatus Yanofskybacteria bacterium GW2011_GWA2_44_9]|uniref:Uncharacterized protein n=1 Tax=Candidatus Yanofskybacteria bacterium GW2011_GWA2_44_9 TaxID=1619025 RepID=A0A0G1KDZ7_9BACT|nr:MAG: hypothetical protein UW79_C0015G0019 [Candidatus Yanofskybacteria bacterium GW2011_GWA2_44_9]OGN05055.1 MAG: hypothetical protein A2659_01340 [Candidatus Yanofskybacteria bacterium RIFCSPHIGHO2_01_FULL_44_24]